MSRTAKVRKSYDANRASPFVVSWNIKGKRFSKFFKTEAEQENFAMKMSPYVNEDKSEIFSLSPTDISDILTINSERENVSFIDIWRFYQKHHKTREVVSLLQGADVYIRSLRIQELDPNYITHARRIMERLCESYGDELLTSIKRETLENWIAALPYCSVTQRNYRSTIRAAWTFFERKEWIDKNIAMGMKIPKIVMGEIGIFTVEETEKLLRSNENIDPEVCGLLALGLFAGMRTSAIARVSYDEINFKERGILTPAEKTKKQRRNYIENLPDNLWAWLERTPKSAFTWCERKFKKRRERALRRAGLLVNSADVKRLAKDNANASGNRRKVSSMEVATRYPPHNAMRHSFASYHVAWKRNFQDTALILSHTGTDILFKHYRGNATKEDAERYFNIYPAK